MGPALLASPFRERRTGQRPHLCRLPCALNSSSCGLPSRLVPSLLGPDGLLFSPFCHVAGSPVGGQGLSCEAPPARPGIFRGRCFHPALPPKPLSLLRLTIRGEASGGSQRRPPDSVPARPRHAGTAPLLIGFTSLSARRSRVWDSGRRTAGLAQFQQNEKSGSNLLLTI